MIPVETSTPINAGCHLQVLWDDHVVDQGKTTAARVAHHPEFAGVVMTHDSPWEGDGSDYHVIVPDRDERGGFLRMYYNGCAIGCGWRDVKDRFSADGVRVCYAESRDGGLIWNKPNLSIAEFRGSKDNNIVMDEALFGSPIDNFFVFRDTHPGCPPEERFKAVTQRLDPPGLDGDRKTSLWCFISGDGLHFRRGWEMTRLGAFDSLNTAFWDETRGEYHLYFRWFHNDETETPEKWDNRNKRDIRHAVSKDFKTWTAPERLDFGENAEDYPLYTNVIQPYFREPAVLVGFPSRYVERPEWTPNFGRLPSPEKRRWRMDTDHGGHPRYGLTITDCVFIMSRDGRRFSRDEDAFMRPGPENSGNWVYGDCYPAYGLVATPSPFGGDDEMSIYTFDRHWTGLPSRLMRHRLRQDGFVSRHAPYFGAKVVTKPLVFEGAEMFVNFSTSARGRMFVNIRDEKGHTLKSVELFGDKVDRVVDFARGATVADFAGKPVVVEFEMFDADLYSFRFGTPQDDRAATTSGQRQDHGPVAVRQLFGACLSYEIVRK